MTKWLEIGFLSVIERYVDLLSNSTLVSAPEEDPDRPDELHHLWWMLIRLRDDEEVHAADLRRRSFLVEQSFNGVIHRGMVSHHSGVDLWDVGVDRQRFVEEVQDLFFEQLKNTVKISPEFAAKGIKHEDFIEFRLKLI